jgi:hypothetical protein
MIFEDWDLFCDRFFHLPDLARTIAANRALNRSSDDKQRRKTGTVPSP